jgi:hypothetical protein
MVRVGSYPILELVKSDGSTVDIVVLPTMVLLSSISNLLDILTSHCRQ